VSVEGDDGEIASREVLAHPLDLIGVHIGRSVFDRGGEIENDFIVDSGLPNVGDRFADLQREVQFGAGEALGGILQLQASAGGGQRGNTFLEQGDCVGGDALDGFAVRVEDVFPLGGGGRVVEVENNVGGSGDGFAGPVDQIFAALAEDLNRNVGGDAVFLNEAAAEIEFNLRRGREAYLDLGEADANQQVEIFELLLDAHGLSEGLVTIAQIDAAPDRRMSEGATGPLPIGQIEGRERAILQVRRRDGHGKRN